MASPIRSTFTTEEMRLLASIGYRMALQHFLVPLVITKEEADSVIVIEGLSEGN